MDKQAYDYMVVGLVFVLVSYLAGGAFGNIEWFGPTFKNMMLVFAPATFVVGLKYLFKGK